MVLLAVHFDAQLLLGNDTGKRRYWTNTIVKGPGNIVYGLTDSPPLRATALNGVQHARLIAHNLVYRLWMLRAAHAHAARADHFDSPTGEAA